MKVSKIITAREGLQERILIGFIHSAEFCREMSKQLRDEFDIQFDSEVHTKLATLAFRHFCDYGAPIGEAWEDSFESWLESHPNSPRKAAEKLRDAVYELDVDQTVAHPPALADEAHSLFATNFIEDRIEQLDRHCKSRDVEKIVEWSHAIAKRAERRDQDYSVKTIDYKRYRSIVSTLNEEDSLFTFPEDAGRFFDSEMKRSRLVTFMGPEKSGKTHWLIEMTYRALRDHRNVLVINAGDLKTDDYLQRMGARILERPFYPGSFFVPDAENGFDADGNIELIELHAEGFASEIPFNSSQRKVLESRYVTSDPKLKEVFAPIGTIGVQDISNLVNQFDEEEGWVPDVIVIDYVDILAPVPGTTSQDFRHGVNEQWKALRRLSQETQTLVLTATQANRAAYGAKTLISRENASEDKRINAHVNCIIGINVSAEDKKNQIYRLNMPVVREKNINETTILRCAGCVGFSNPLMVARLEDAAFFKVSQKPLLED